MLVELSKAQDIEAGDGTTSVVVLAGALLDACTKLLDKGIHPTIIADTFLRCAAKAQEILGKIAIPVSLDDRDSLIRAASTSLSSKVVSNNSQVLSPIAVDAVLRVADQTVVCEAKTTLLAVSGTSVRGVTWVGDDVFLTGWEQTVQRWSWRENALQFVGKVDVQVPETGCIDVAACGERVWGSVCGAMGFEVFDLSI